MDLREGGFRETKSERRGLVLRVSNAVVFSLGFQTMPLSPLQPATRRPRTMLRRKFQSSPLNSHNKSPRACDAALPAAPDPDVGVLRMNPLDPKWHLGGRTGRQVTLGSGPLCASVSPSLTPYFCPSPWTHLVSSAPWSAK